MAQDARRVSDLTRALMIAASVGGTALVPIGCSDVTGAIPDFGSGQKTDGAAERKLCAQVLESENPRDLERLMETYPRSTCLNPTLTALPPHTLAQVSPAVLAGLPLAVRNRIPPQAAVYLRLPRERSSENQSFGGAS